MNLGESRHAALPLRGIVPEQVIDSTGELFETAGSRAGICALDRHAHEADSRAVRRTTADERAGVQSGGTVTEGKGRTIAPKINGMVASTSEEADLLIRLAAIGLEVERKIAEARSGG